MIRRAIAADAVGIAQVHISSWRSSYTGIIPDSYLDALDVDDREKVWQQRLEDTAHKPAIFVAEAEPGKIVGFAAVGPEMDDTPGFDAEVYALYLHQSAQRQGIGRELFSTCARHAAHAGYQSLLVWALVQNNPARAFYEMMGGRIVSEKMINIGETELLEVSYGWPDIHTLFSD